MTAIQTALKLWVKMTLVDGTIHEQEREFLAYMLQTYAPEHDLDTLIEAVRDTDLATLTGQVDAYADRFFYRHERPRDRPLRRHLQRRRAPPLPNIADRV